MYVCVSLYMYVCIRISITCVILCKCWVCMYVYVSLYMYVCIRINITCVILCACWVMYVNELNMNAYVCMYVYVSLYMYVRICKFIDVCMYTYKYYMCNFMCMLGMYVNELNVNAYGWYLVIQYLNSMLEFIN